MDIPIDSKCKKALEINMLTSRVCIDLLKLKFFLHALTNQNNTLKFTLLL